MKTDVRSALLAVLLACCATPPPAEAPRPPVNVVLIMTDDQGYGDFGHAGNPVLDTPHLDALAAVSPTVERFYVSPVCSPTRACLMTGRYNYRTRVVDTWRGRTAMEPDEVTLAEILRDAGYATGIFGKWHLGDNYPQRAMDQGFRESLVHRGGGLAQPSEPIENRRRYSDSILIRNGEVTATDGYCTDVYFDAAQEFISASHDAGRPFFAYVATNAPHDPFHDVPAALYAKYAARDLTPVARGATPDLDRIARTFAMIENIDENVGRLLTFLDEAGLADDTLVVFLDDNGPLGGRTAGGLRGNKGQVYEGGIRTPLFVRLGDELSPDTTVSAAGAHIDLLPTILDALDVEVPGGLALDGRSLWPELRGRPGVSPERHLVIQSHRGDVPSREHNVAVIGPRWKLVRPSGFGREQAPEDAPFELYDLPADPTESRDLAAAHPDVVAALRDVYERWFDDVSSTRADNFAPPPIVFEPAAEPVVTLTRNDWRRRGDDGRDDGHWVLRFPRQTRLAIRLRFPDRRSVASVSLTLGDGRHRACTIAARRVSDELTEIDLAPLTVGAGRTTFRLACRGEDGRTFGPYQVELREH